jgi:hyperosmotically inducible periplasmic protein
MRITLNSSKRALLSVMGVITVAALITSCSSTGSRTRGQKMSDRQVTRGVKKALSNDPTFKYPDVHANVYDGNIQLTGFVETPEQRLRAAERAANTRGAKQVINEIMIKPTPTGKVSIRDPLGHETGRVLVDTNTMPPQLRNLPPSGTQPQRAQPGASEATGEGTNPK